MLQPLVTWLALLVLLLVLTCGAIKSSSCLMVLSSLILMKMLSLTTSRAAWLKLVCTNVHSHASLFFSHTHGLIAAVNDGKLPKVMVMGALGRCGTGACDFARKAGIPEENIIKWDMNETKGGGPFPQILEAGKLKGCYGMKDFKCNHVYFSL